MRKVSEIIRPNLKYQEAIVKLTRKGDKAKAKECLEAFTAALENGPRSGYVATALEIVLERKGPAAVEEVRSECFRSLNLSERYQKMGRNRAVLMGELLSLDVAGLKKSVIEAIDSGDAAGVKVAVEAYNNSYERAGKDKHQFGGIVLDWIRRNIGEGAVYEVFDRSLGLNSRYGKNMDSYGQNPQWLLNAQEGLKGGLTAWTSDSAYPITETDDEISYDYLACHSGGRFREGTLDKKDWGLLTEPAAFALNDQPGEKAQPGLRGKNDAVAHVPGPQAKGKKGIYPYCVHCGVLDVVYKAKGTLLQFHYGTDPQHGDPCRFIISKPKGSTVALPTLWFKKWE